MLYDETLAAIVPPDETAMEAAWKRWDSIAKPLRSLGKLEEMVVRLAGIYRTDRVSLGKKALIPMCADNGVVAEGVTQTGQEVTAIVAENFLHEKSSVAIMCRETRTDKFPVDDGMVTDTAIETHKVAYGPKNLRVEPAMTREEAIATIETGIRKVQELKAAGYGIIATGEMGIGNTTTSSAIAAVLLPAEVETVTGKGAGLTSAGLQTKIDVIKEAIAKHQPDPKDPLDVLAKVGGFDIAGLVGVYLGCAANHLPAVVDGFISGVAALVAVRLNPLVQGYLIPSHVSKEPAGHMIMDALRISPLLTCDMCLGEGTGAVAVLPVIELGLSVYTCMSTFDDIEIDAYQPLN